MKAPSEEIYGKLTQVL